MKKWPSWSMTLVSCSQVDGQTYQMMTQHNVRQSYSYSYSLSAYVYTHYWTVMCYEQLQELIPLLFKLIANQNDEISLSVLDFSQSLLSLVRNTHFHWSLFCHFSDTFLSFSLFFDTFTTFLLFYDTFPIFSSLLRHFSLFSDTSRPISLKHREKQVDTFPANQNCLVKC